MIKKFICAIVVLSLLNGCTFIPTRLPPYQTSGLRIPPAKPQDDSPCANLQYSPKTAVVVHKGEKGFWVSRARMTCFVARSHVARACRPACEKRVAMVIDGHLHLKNAILKASGRREKLLLEQFKKHEKKLALQGIVVGVSVLIVGVGAGIVVGVIISK